MFRPALIRLFVSIVAVTVLVPARWWPPAGAPAVVHAQAAPAQAGPAQSYEGILSVIWGDPYDQRSAGAIRYILTTADGRDLQLRLTGQEGAALLNQRKRVVVTGREAAVSGPAGLPAETTLLVDSLAPAAGAQAVAPDTEAAVTGTRKVLFLLVKFNDDAAVPHAPAFFTGLTNPDTPPPGLGIPATINAFFKKTSNNQFSWIADVGGNGGLGAPVGDGWITLPRPKSGYAPCGFSSVCFNFTLFNNEAVAAGKAQGINFAPYDNVNFVVSNDLDCCAWGGSVVIDGKAFGSTWEPPWGQEPRVYSHEMGHSIGLPHSGWVYFAYDSPWDVMSGYSDLVITTCGSYASKNGGSSTLSCREPGNGYIAAHRDFLGWFPPANVVTTNTTSSVTVTLEGAALPMGATPKMIKICLPGLSCTAGGSGHYMTVEARTKNAGTTSLFDNGIPAEGVIIHDVLFGRSPIGGACFFNTQSGWAVPIDATPGDYNTATCPGSSPTSNPGLYNAQFNPGQTYTNSTYGFRVSVLSRSGATFQVAVQTTVATEISLDSPANSSTVAKPFTVSGWSVNRQATSGTGVDAVHVYATPTGGGAAIFLGAATYGTARSDIGALYGAQFTNSGYTLSAGASLAPGGYVVTAYAHSTVTGAFDAARSVTITVTGPVSDGLINIDSPTNGQLVTSAFEIGGWAIDRGAPSGTGVDAIQFYVFPNDGASPGVFVGNGSYGAARTDVGAAYGSRFTNSGYHFTITGLGPGNFLLGAYARSTLTGTFSVVKTVHISVNPNQLMSIDIPSPESSISAAVFDVAGWSIDRAVATGTGVDSLHVYAYPNPGSGQAPIFLGVATVGFARSDVAALYGARFTNSGYNLTVSRAAVGLTPGVYSIVVHSHSTSGSFNNLAVVRVTLQ